MQSDSKMFISHQHAAADGAGLDSPGPCNYNFHNQDLAVVTSKFKKSGGIRFGSSQRFKINYNTF